MAKVEVRMLCPIYYFLHPSGPGCTGNHTISIQNSLKLKFLYVPPKFKMVAKHEEIVVVFFWCVCVCGGGVIWQIQGFIA